MVSEEDLDELRESAAFMRKQLERWGERVKARPALADNVQNMRAYTSLSREYRATLKQIDEYDRADRAEKMLDI
jgi:hypothetical protein